jgi:hypothetical protein
MNYYIYILCVAFSSSAFSIGEYFNVIILLKCWSGANYKIIAISLSYFYVWFSNLKIGYLFIYYNLLFFIFFVFGLLVSIRTNTKSITDIYSQESSVDIQLL